MIRSKFLFALSMLLAALLVAGAGPARAHGPHKLGVASAEMARASVRTAAIHVVVVAKAGATTELDVPAGDVWLVAGNSAGDANSCHGMVSCCANHCCVSGALTVTPAEATPSSGAGMTTPIAASQPDDAPVRTGLRPPCR